TPVAHLAAAAWLAIENAPLDPPAGLALPARRGATVEDTACAAALHRHAELRVPASDPEQRRRLWQRRRDRRDRHDRGWIWSARRRFAHFHQLANAHGAVYG